MTIDWSKAPEYATHWCPKINMFHTDAALCEECIPRPQGSNAADQEKRILVETFVAGPGRDRIVMGDSERVMRHGDKVEIYLTRAQSPEVEWDGEGLPPVGCECEYRSKGGSLNNGPHTDWRYCRVLAMTHFYAIISLRGPGIASNHECSVTLSRSEFRPIRTKAQRDRDELVSLIVDYTISEIHPNRLADAIISRYNLEPKDV